ncbi:MAG: phosphotransferase family protein [Porticoccaceae bacterium]|jgi:aminoglycoside phosphotransferase (APT) family kinase protein|nr:phosphotransferase family protein [Porticoccaceae bacterium]MDG2501573.1 phosphotransferase family protein [Porticoccaceae bacterium]
MSTGDIQGYDVPAVEQWIKAHIPSLTPPFDWVQLEGGHSNLTYLLQDQKGLKAVVRRPPLGRLLPKAHDMSREWAFISSLAPTGFPVPAALGFCEDTEITGAWFYVMGFKQGRPLHSRDETEVWVSRDQRVTLAHSFIDTLADLHTFDPDTIGLGTLAKKEGYVARQIKTWYRSWEASIEPAKYDDPRAHDLRSYYLDNTPAQIRASVVHGDYGFHNCLIGSDATVTAVVDWEIGTLGDPLADLGYSLKSWPESAADIARTPDAPMAAEGLPFRWELAQRYAERTGLSVRDLDFYISINHWKGAAIIHGVYARYLAGQKSTEGIDLDLLRSRITLSLDRAEEALSRFIGS